MPYISCKFARKIGICSFNKLMYTSIEQDLISDTYTLTNHALFLQWMDGYIHTTTTPWKILEELSGQPDHHSDPLRHLSLRFPYFRVANQRNFK